MIPSKAAEAFIEEVHIRVGAKTKAILGRSAVSLALSEGIPENYKMPPAKGKDIGWEALVGDLESVFHAAINYRAGKTLGKTAFQREFRRAFEFGCKRMEKIWEDCGHDQARFVAKLLEFTKPSDIEFSSDKGEVSGLSSIVESEVILKLLTNTEPWSINGKTTKNALLIISGQPGSGKTQLALDLLAQLSRQGVRFLFFDLKGELEEAGDDRQKAEARKRFFDLTGAQYYRLIDTRLPINPLYAGKNEAETASIASKIAGLVRAFGPQMGPNQEDALREAFMSLDTTDFPSMLAALQANEEEGVAVSVLKKLVDLNIFAPVKKALSFDEWASQSNIIDLKPLDNDTRVLVVAFILNFFIERLSQNLSTRNGIQPLQLVLFVDEAHNILPKDGKAQLLERLAREGRSWGFPLWLASQDADKFVSRSANFSKLASTAVHLSPETLKPHEQKEILGLPFKNPLGKGEGVLKTKVASETGPIRQFWRDEGK